MTRFTCGAFAPQVLHLFLVAAFALADFAPKGAGIFHSGAAGFGIRDDGGGNIDAGVYLHDAWAQVEYGRAKVNLTLRVVGRRVDGYHDLESVVAFADCADRLTLTAGPELELKAIGPLAEACGVTADNLVLKAARLLAERVSGLKVGDFTLEKVLPVAAGIGGGSADAAAAFRLLARLNGLELDDPRVRAVALATGADVPVCLASYACDMTGVGETLLPLSLPELPCVMVNPRVPVATKDVFARRSACATANFWSASPM